MQAFLLALKVNAQPMPMLQATTFSRRQLMSTRALGRPPPAFSAFETAAIPCKCGGPIALPNPQEQELLVPEC
jgi:hypothetical protein